MTGTGSMMTPVAALHAVALAAGAVPATPATILQAAPTACAGASTMTSDPDYPNGRTTMVRSGTGHRTVIVQQDPGGTVHLEQHGADHLVHARQSGSGDRLVVRQDGDGAVADVDQSGGCHAVDLRQNGRGNRAHVAHSGAGNSVVIRQGGVPDAEPRP
jgi:hypothetical protein